MKYILTDGNGNYLKYDNRTKLTITKNKNNAHQFAQSKAENVIKNSMTKAERERWFAQEYSILGATDKIQNTPIKPTEKTENWLNQIRNIKNVVGEIGVRREELHKKSFIIEKEMCDIYHYIELTDGLSASEGYKAYKTMREKLKERREVKDELKIIDYMLESKVSDISSGQLDKCVVGLEGRQYRPRAMNELFED